MFSTLSQLFFTVHLLNTWCGGNSSWWNLLYLTKSFVRCLDFYFSTSVSNSVLIHSSVWNWIKEMKYCSGVDIHYLNNVNVYKDQFIQGCCGSNWWPKAAKLKLCTVLCHCCSSSAQKQMPYTPTPSPGLHANNNEFVLRSLSSGFPEHWYIDWGWMQTDRGQRSFTVHCFNPTAALPVHFDDHGWASLTTNCCISAGLRWQKEPAGEGKYRKN